MKYEPPAGQEVGDAAAKMVQMANKSGEIVNATFNNIELEAFPHGNTKAWRIVEYYYREMANRPKPPVCDKCNGTGRLQP